MAFSDRSSNTCPIEACPFPWLPETVRALAKRRAVIGRPRAKWGLLTSRYAGPTEVFTQGHKNSLDCYRPMARNRRLSRCGCALSMAKSRSSKRPPTISSLRAARLALK